LESDLGYVGAAEIERQESLENKGWILHHACFAARDKFDETHRKRQFLTSMSTKFIKYNNLSHQSQRNSSKTTIYDINHPNDNLSLKCR
jgi:hypothetical protein